MRQKTVEEDYFVAQYDRIVSGSQSFLYLEPYFNIRLSFGQGIICTLDICKEIIHKENRNGDSFYQR